MLQVKDWASFQHYKDRNPPWIKLQTDTFQNYDFSCLQSASKLLAICIWTLASRSKEGFVPHNFDYIKRWGQLGNDITEKHLKELIDKGYLVDVANPLADCKQGARPETYREEAYSEEADKKEKKVVGKRFALQDPPIEWISFCQTQRPDLDAGMTFDSFRDYWAGVAGARGVKLDWSATWRNWVRNQKQKQNSGGSYDRIDAVREASRIALERML